MAKLFDRKRYGTMNPIIESIFSKDPYPFFDKETDRRSLLPLREAVLRTEKEIREHPDHQSLQIEACIFFAEKLLSVFRGRDTDYSDLLLKDHYDFVHQFFGSSLYEPFNRNSVLPGQTDTFLWFLTVKEVGYEDFLKRANVPVTVSFTSFPARIQFAADVVRSVLAQTKQADSIQLWLAEEQFPEKEKDVPDELLQLKEEGKLELRWCDDLKPHKKYYYSLQEVRDGVVITIDDDVNYPTHMIEELMLSYIRHPSCISANRAHYMTINDEGELLPYSFWLKETDAFLNRPSQQLLATGCGGVLYPADLLGQEVFDKDAIKKTSLMADDLWLKATELMEGIPVVVASPYRHLSNIKGSQDDSLWNVNKTGGNDAALQRIAEWIDEEHRTGFFSDCLKKSADGESWWGFEALCNYSNLQIDSFKRQQNALSHNLDRLNRELQQRTTELQRQTAKKQQLEKRLAEIQSGPSFRIGRVITWIPRRIKAFISRIRKGNK